MAYTDLLAAKYLAFAWEQEANGEATDYLGSRLFGFKKQMSLELKWLKGSGGLPIAIAPAAFDAEIPLRSRIGAAKVETEMPLFREGYQITESDRRALMEAVALGDSYVQDVMSRIFNDTNNLIRGAKVVPEIMIWQLLAPTDGKPKISMVGKDATYAYNYDPNGTWYANNFIDVSSAAWSAAATAKPITNLIAAKNAAAAKGVILEYVVMNSQTFSKFSNTAEVKSAVLAQNATATVFLTPTTVKQAVKDITGLAIIVYDGVYKDYAGVTKKFMPDKVVTIIPDGMLGNMVYGTTSEEYELKGDSNKNVAIVDDGIAISTVCTSEMPPRVATYASEICLPTYERMDEVFELKVDADNTDDGGDDGDNG